MDLASSLNWDLVSRKEYVAEMVSEGPPVKEYKPLPPVSFIVDSNILQIGVDSKSAKPHWKLGASVTQRLLMSPSSTSEFVAAVVAGDRKQIRLRALTLVRFPDFGVTPFLLTCEFPFWLEDAYMEIWKYSE